MILEINEKTKEGKSLVSFLRELAKNSSFIKLISDKDAEGLEDQQLAKLMEKSRTGSFLSEREKTDFLQKVKNDAK